MQQCRHWSYCSTRANSAQAYLSENLRSLRYMYPAVGSDFSVCGYLHESSTSKRLKANHYQVPFLKSCSDFFFIFRKLFPIKFYPLDRTEITFGSLKRLPQSEILWMYSTPSLKTRLESYYIKANHTKTLIRAIIELQGFNTSRRKVATAVKEIQKTQKVKRLQ